MNEAKAPSQEALLAQLKELNQRSSGYGRQFWQVPFAYIAGAGIAVLQATEEKHGPLALALTLAASGVVGGFVVWHLVALCSAAHRSYRAIKDCEQRLSLSSDFTRWTPGHLHAFLVLTIVASLAALAAAAYLIFCRRQP